MRARIIERSPTPGFASSRNQGGHDFPNANVWSTAAGAYGGNSDPFWGGGGDPRHRGSPPPPQKGQEFLPYARGAVEHQLAYGGNSDPFWGGGGDPRHRVGRDG